VAALGLVGGSADAADLAPIYKAAPAPYVSSWSGFYVGIGVGGRWMDNDWTTTAAFDPNGVLIPFTTDPNASFNNGAFRVSGYAGHNWQVAPMWVAGVEADFGWADNHSTLASRIPGLGVLNAGSFT
jgi:outer membrane immunogenic protein